ncbi:MAG: APC family permease [Acidobacteriota bacterium]
MSVTSVPDPLQTKAPSKSLKSVAKLTLWPLVAATFFMVCGGAYGTEDIVHGWGYGRALVILTLTPLLWSLPVTLMVGELSSTLPAEGGYYAWVRAGLGDFWGFQEVWLSFASSIFDMAIYPTLFIAYLERWVPWFGVGHRGIVVGLLMILACTALNLAGIHTVGITSFWLFLVIAGPFALIVLIAPFKAGALAHVASPPATTSVGLLGGTLVAMWNYMGWDSASTIARGVERPERTYPRAMFLSVTLVALTYLLPVAAVWVTGLPSSTFETGSWATVAGLVGGNWLRALLVLGGMVSAFGIFNALVMSYSRLPLAMAQDGMLPRVFAKVHPKTKAPWVAILACAAGWALCLGLGFESLVTLDILLCGASLVLEFMALVALRVRQPGLPRPFRVPGGLAGAILVGVSPTFLLVLSLVRSSREEVFGMNGLTFGVLAILAGFVLYYATRPLRQRHSETVAAESSAGTSIPPTP